MARTGWNESEIRATISEYFNLLDSQEKNIVINKRALYRRLSSNFPERSPKAFELKFQNISAILYEENLPYCDGLKPRFNYQHLLRLLVLDELRKSPIPVQEPHIILFRKLKELKQNGHIKVTGRGSGRFGLSIEKSLGIPQNSSKSADFMGIELKTKSDKSLQTLFSRVPTRYKNISGKQELVEKYGYFDEKRERQALYTSFSNSTDSLGFHLRTNNQSIQVINNGVELLEYDAEVIEAALLSKHSRTAYINLEVTKSKGEERCSIKNVLYAEWPSIIRFMRLINKGDVFLDFTLSKSKSKIKDHGFLWRIRPEALSILYLKSEVKDLK